MQLTGEHMELQQHSIQIICHYQSYHHPKPILQCKLLHYSGSRKGQMQQTFLKSVQYS